MNKEIYHTDVYTTAFTNEISLQTKYVRDLKFTVEPIAEGSYAKVYLEDGNKVIKVFENHIDAIIEILHLRRLMPYFNCNAFYFVLPEVIYWTPTACGVSFPRGNENLAQAIQRGITVDVQYSIMFHLAKGIEMMHHFNVAHLDLKPENIIMFNNTPRITDFGLSAGKVCHKQIQGEKFTLIYRAPELNAPPGVNNSNDSFNGMKADIWALGIIFLTIYLGYNPVKKLYTSITQNFPNLWTSNVIQEIMSKLFIVDSPENIFRQLQTLNATPEFIILMQGMLNINPIQRYSSTEVVNSPFFFNIYSRSILPRVNNQNCLCELKRTAYYPPGAVTDERTTNFGLIFALFARKQITNSTIIQRSCFLYDYCKYKTNLDISMDDFTELINIIMLYEKDKVFTSINKSLVILTWLDKINYRVHATVLSDFCNALLSGENERAEYDLIANFIYFNLTLLLRYPLDILATATACVAAEKYGQNLYIQHLTAQLQSDIRYCAADIKSKILPAIAKNKHYLTSWNIT